MSKRRKKTISLDKSLLVFKRELLQIIFVGISDNDTTEKVERYSSDRSTYESDLQDLLLKCYYRVIHGLFKRYFNRKKHTSKIHIVQALLAKFYESESSFEKRENESDNIKNFLSDRNSVENLNFLVMSDILVPQEILMTILSYLPRNEHVLFHVGSICKAVYFHIMNSWDSIFIEKKNVYEISLLVLNSIKKVSFVERKTKSLYNFTISEMEYLFSKFNPNKLREIEICTSRRRSYEILRNFEKCVDGKEINRKVFNNIETLSFTSRLGLYNIGYKDVTLFPNYPSPCDDYECFFKIFPKVKDIKYPPEVEFATGCKTLQSFSDSVCSGDIKKYEQIAPSLRNLSLILPRDDFPEEMYLHFVNLEKFCISVIDLEPVFSPSLNHCYSKTSAKKSICAIEMCDSLSKSTNGPFKSFFGGETNPEEKVTCFESLKELTICSILRRAFIDLPMFENLFKEIFPNLTRFTCVLKLSDEGSEQREQTFAKRLIENALPRMEYFDCSFQNKVEVGEDTTSTLLQIVYSRKRRELKIRILGSLYFEKEYFERRRKIWVSPIHCAKQIEKTSDLYESFIHEIRMIKKKRFPLFRRLVIVHDVDCELLKIKVGNNKLGNYILQEEYKNWVTIEQYPLFSWFNFGDGITEKKCPHYLYFLDN